jgi:hypothetical protein
MTVPPPWLANERWTYWIDSTGKHYAKVEGRERCPASLKRNLIWLVQNTYEQQASEAPWWHPEWPENVRELYWNYLRNPLQNMRLFVLGWADRNYTVDVLEGNPDPMVVQRNDVGELGYQRTRLRLNDGSGIRFFTSYSRSAHSAWYIGTQPSGIYGIKWDP